MDEKKPWYKQKTTWAAIGTLAGAAGGYATGEMTGAQAGQLLATALIGMFLRQGVESSK